MNAAAIRLLADKGLSASEIAEVAEALEPKRSSGAERQARYRARKAAESDTSDVTSDVTEHNEAPLSAPPNDIYSNPPHHTPNTKSGGRDDFPCPDWCEADVWRDLKRNRKTKKLTNTPTAHKRFVAAILDMADDDWPPGKLVEAIAAEGWGGPHDPRKKRRFDNGNGRQFGNSNQRTAELAQAKLQSLG